MGIVVIDISRNNGAVVHLLIETYTCTSRSYVYFGFNKIYFQLRLVLQSVGQFHNTYTISITMKYEFSYLLSNSSIVLV